MNKLEELKALIIEEKNCWLEWQKSRSANDDLDDVNSLLSFYRSTKRNRVALSEELLPLLIAVSEAAKNLALNDFTRRGDALALVKALEPLTKDTDK